MFERFTTDARAVVTASLGVAAGYGTDVEPVHLLIALAERFEAARGEGATAPRSGPAGRVLARHGVTAALLRGAYVAGPGQPGTAEPASPGAAFTAEEIAALRSIGIDAAEVLRRIEAAFGAGALHAGPPAGRGRDRRRWRDGPFGGQARKVLELTLREALALRHRQLGAEHILLALLRTGLPAPVAAVLEDRGLSYPGVRREIVEGPGRAA